MIAELASAWTGLNAAKDIVKGLNALENATAVNEVKVALQTHILEAQQGLFAAQQAEATSASRIANLETEIMRLKDWSSERERYELVAVGEGGFAYMLKAGMRESQPAHWLCTQCFDDGKKSIMQKQMSKVKDANLGAYECPRCHATMATHWHRTPSYQDGPEG